MKWKEVTGIICFASVFISFILIVYFNMNYGWFYPYRDTSMLIPMILTIIGIIFLFASIKINNSWEWLGDAYDY